jgi:hypothetical protein
MALVDRCAPGVRESPGSRRAVRGSLACVLRGFFLWGCTLRASSRWPVGRAPGLRLGPGPFGSRLRGPTSSARRPPGEPLAGRLSIRPCSAAAAPVPTTVTVTLAPAAMATRRSAPRRSARAPAGTGLTPATSAPPAVTALPPHPHLHLDRAQPLPHLHRDRGSALPQRPCGAATAWW